MLFGYREIIPVFCFDPRFNQQQVQKYDIRKAGIWRSRFLIETVEDFRRNLKGLGSGLLVSQDTPEEFLKSLVNPALQTTLVFQAETSDEEVKIEALVREKMREADPACNIVSIWGSTLHHMDDLPYDPVEYFPHTYGNMRKKQVEVKVRPMVETPDIGSLPFLDESNTSE